MKNERTQTHICICERWPDMACPRCLEDIDHPEESACAKCFGQLHTDNSYKDYCGVCDWDYDKEPCDYKAHHERWESFVKAINDAVDSVVQQFTESTDASV